MFTRDNTDFFNWYNGSANPNDKTLYEKVSDFAQLFEDMLFQPGTATYAMIQCKSMQADGEEWEDDTAPLPFELEYFSYQWFYYNTEELQEGNGCFDVEKQLLCVPQRSLEDDTTILHEMIHLHEVVIDALPNYFHDTLLWSLYTDLKKKIPKLDEIITEQAHILQEWSIYRYGGNHDILFLLKSFDLDIKMGHPLGTVFAYGKNEDLKQYEYIATFKTEGR